MSFSKLPFQQERTALTEEIAQILLPSRAQSAESLLAVIVSGLGGVGKTEIVREFVRTYESHFDAVFFLVADDRERLRQQCTDVALEMGLISQQPVQNIDDALLHLKTWLANPVRNVSSPGERPNRLSGHRKEKAKWLLVFDNADNPDILSEFWPATGFGSVLVTSRDPNTSTQYYPSAKHIELEPMSTEEATTLLKNLTHTKGGSENDAAAEKIVQQLDGLPLAIDQIGSIMAQQRLSLHTFVQYYPDYHSLYDQRSYKRGYEYSLGSVWAFDVLQQKDKRALQLLNVFAMLDPAQIPETILLNTLQYHEVRDYPRDTTEYLVVSSRLIAQSMVRRDSGNETFSIHRLVQDVARARLVRDLATCLSIFTIVSKSVKASWSHRTQEINQHGLVSRWNQCRTIYPHIVKLHFVAKEMINAHQSLTFSAGFIELLYEAAWYVAPKNLGTSEQSSDINWSQVSMRERRSYGSRAIGCTRARTMRPCPEGNIFGERPRPLG